jgi:hypothetical protein
MYSSKNMIWCGNLDQIQARTEVFPLHKFSASRCSQLLPLIYYLDNTWPHLSTYEYLHLFIYKFLYNKVLLRAELSGSTALPSAISHWNSLRYTHFLSFYASYYIIIIHAIFFLCIIFLESKFKFFQFYVYILVCCSFLLISGVPTKL